MSKHSKITSCLVAATNTYPIKAPHMKETVIGYKNPSKKDLINATIYDVVNALLVENDLYIWGDALHDTAINAFGLSSKINSVVPLTIFMDGSNFSGILVTDTSKRTKWHHNPNVYDKIIKNKWILSNTPTENLNDPDFVSYYDEAIVGKWHEQEKSVAASRKDSSMNKEIIFQSTDEAFQMLANITGKKIKIPNKAESKTASENESIKAEGDLEDVSQDLIQKGEKYRELGEQVADAAQQMEDVTGSF